MDEKMQSGILDVMRELEYLRGMLADISTQDASDSIYALIRVLENVTGLKFYPTALDDVKRNAPNSDFTVTLVCHAGRGKRVTKEDVEMAIQEYVAECLPKIFSERDAPDTAQPELDAETVKVIDEFIRQACSGLE